ncbi:hypothetical protein [Winogradskyella sp.]|uniref:hypothetical protein n=1 Tax=Winogradskyella sp. TaxID=1883156 RepID=UPI00260D4CFD|nr:hypothetical protein [Winogradskyella sp.]
MLLKNLKPSQINYVFVLALILFSVQACSDDDDGSDDPQLLTENVTIGAQATFLRVDDVDTSTNSAIVNLSSLNISPGDVIRLKTIGTYINSPTGSTRDSAAGVFSSSNLLLGSSELNRVVDAIDAGTDNVTENTFEEDQVTDIPEDFRIDENQIQITVPAGAQFLFLGVADSKLSDNMQSTEGFAIEIRY